MIPANISIDLMSIATSSAILGSAMYYARGNSSLPQEEYVDQLMTLLVRGVCPFATEKH